MSDFSQKCPKKPRFGQNPLPDGWSIFLKIVHLSTPPEQYTLVHLSTP